MLCAKCGNQLDKNQRFCANCGSRADNEASLQAAEAGVSSPRSIVSKKTTPATQSKRIVDPVGEVTPKGQESERLRHTHSTLLYSGLVVCALLALTTAFMFLRHFKAPAVNTDADIVKSIQFKFSSDPTLSRCALEVKSNHGAVTLTGMVPTDSDKAAAEPIASQEKGVREVDVFGVTAGGFPASQQNEGSSNSSRSQTKPDASIGEGNLKNMVNIAPFIFEGAYANYAIHYGSLSIPLRVRMSNVDHVSRQFRATIRVGDPLVFRSGNVILGFDQSIEELLPPRYLDALREGTIPPHYDFPGAHVLRNVPVVVPAGSFLTEKLTDQKNSFYYDSHSGLLVEAEGPDFVAQYERDLPNVPRPVTCTLELVSTAPGLRV